MSESEVDRIRIGPLGFSFDKGKPLIGAKVSKVRVRTTVPAPNTFPPRPSAPGYPVARPPAQRTVRKNRHGAPPLPSHAGPQGIEYKPLGATMNVGAFVDVAKQVWFRSRRDGRR